MGSGRGKNRRARHTTAPTAHAVFTNVVDVDTADAGVVFSAEATDHDVVYGVVWSDGTIAHGVTSREITPADPTTSRPYTASDWVGRDVVFRSRGNIAPGDALEELNGQRARVKIVRTPALSSLLSGQPQANELMFELEFANGQVLRWLTLNDVTLLEDAIAHASSAATVDVAQRVEF